MAPPCWVRRMRVDLWPTEHLHDCFSSASSSSFSLSSSSSSSGSYCGSSCESFQYIVLDDQREDQRDF